MGPTPSPNSGVTETAADNRAHPRTSRVTGLRIRRLGSEEYDAVCADYSEGGIGADVGAVFQVGEVVEVDFSGEGASCPRLARIVYRINGNHYGMRFLK